MLQLEKYLTFNISMTETRRQYQCMYHSFSFGLLLFCIPVYKSSYGITIIPGSGKILLFFLHGLGYFMDSIFS